MLNPQALAHAFAAAAALLYVFIYLLKLFVPPLFKLVLNSQFLGADIASLVPDFSFVNFIGILIAICTLSWVFGYLLAQFYNRFITDF